MDLSVYIAIVVLLFFVSVGGFYLFKSFAGPRKLEEVEQLVQNRRFKEAITALTKILEGDDRNMRARYLIAYCHKKEGNNGSAIIEFRQCIKLGKFSPTASEVIIRQGLAESLESSGNFTESKNEYLILTTLDSSNSTHFFHVGRLFFRAGVYSKAINFLLKSASMNEKDGECQALLGQAQYHMTAYQEARASLLKAVQLKSDHLVARYYLGLSLRYLGDNDWALKEFEKAEKDEALKEKAILAKSMILIDQQNYPKAIIELERGLKITTTNIDTTVNLRYLLAMAYEKTRDLGTAIANWEKIENIKPGFRDVKEKLAQYAEYRTDDSVKDYLIASSAQFEAISRKLLENMGLQIQNLHIDSDSQITALAAEEDTNKRAAVRKTMVLALVHREMAAISEKQVRQFHESMKEKGASRGIVLSIGEASPAAINYCSSRPLDIVDASKIVPLIRAAMK